MGIGDGIIKWWLQNFYATKITKYEPGFVITDLGGGFNSFQRLAWFPESVCADIEIKIVQKYGENGKQTLLNLGKNYGYLFCLSLNAPRLGHDNIEKIEKFAKNSVKYGYSSWANDSEILHLNLEKISWKIQFHSHVVCRKNGLGYIFTDGISIGVGEYICKKKMEIVDSKCEGRGDDKCYLDIQAKEPKETIEYHIDINRELYYKLNSIKPSNFSNKSMKDYIDSKIVIIDKGLFYFKDDCIINCYSAFLYLLSTETYKLPSVENLFFDSGYEWAIKKDYIVNLQSISDFFSVMGFGDLIIKYDNNRYTAVINNFIWDSLETQTTDFPLIRGFISGMLSKVERKEIRLRKCEKIHNGSSFAVVLS
jgi:predicted hydrocarbon binding protein